MNEETKPNSDYRLKRYKGALSVFHTGRDILLFQLIVFIAMLVTILITALAISHAQITSNPQEVIQQTQTTAVNIFPYLYLVINIFVGIITYKMKKMVNKIEKDILTTYGENKQ